jgi:predicted ATP-grasp superfamily ATP-dependent carboligase
LKIAIYEYVSGGGYAQQPLPFGLLAEGYGMLRSIAADFKAAGHEVTVLLDERISKLNPRLEADFTVPIIYSSEPQKFLCNISAVNDAVYVIAPETNQILQKLVQSIEANGKICLNSNSKAIEKVSNKATLNQHLNKVQITTPKTLFLNFKDDIAKTAKRINQELTYPIVLKTLDGAGCSGMSIIKTEENLNSAIAKLLKSTTEPQFIAQNYVNGLPASVSVISNGKKAVAISLNKQQITLAQPSEESQYIGGCVPLEHPLSAKACSIAERLVESITGLRGYVGVDVVLSEDTLFVVDVNPRLTTSYVGLHAVADFNVAQALFEAVTTGSLPKKIHNKEVVYFSKIETPQPNSAIYPKLAELDYLCAPPFPSETKEPAYALVMSKGSTMQMACIHIEEAKKAIRSIIS